MLHKVIMAAALVAIVTGAVQAEAPKPASWGCPEGYVLQFSKRPGGDLAAHSWRCEQGEYKSEKERNFLLDSYIESVSRRPMQMGQQFLLSSRSLILEGSLGLAFAVILIMLRRRRRTLKANLALMPTTPTAIHALFMNNKLGMPPTKPPRLSEHQAAAEPGMTNLQPRFCIGDRSEQ